MSSLDASALASLHHIDPRSSLAARLSLHGVKAFARTQEPQTKHRINVVDAWGLQLDGQRVLEVGCGQGDASVVLSSAVGEEGRVTAWDPASPDYGSPVTVGEAQTNLVSKPELNNIDFHLQIPLTHLLDQEYDVAVLLHCIYYFPSAAEVLSTLRLLRSKVSKLCIAEYALSASLPSQHPHVLAVLAQQALGVFMPLGGSQSNVQTVLSPRAILHLAQESGWDLQHETVITPAPELQDGRWETSTVYDSAWLNEINAATQTLENNSTRQREWLRAARDATISAVGALEETETGSQKPMDLVRTMDVWCAVLTRDSAPGRM